MSDVLQRATLADVRTISQRELRNQSAQIIRELLSGQTFRITNHGRPVGVLSPLSGSSLDDLTLRAGTQDMSFGGPGLTVEGSVHEALADLRDER